MKFSGPEEIYKEDQRWVWINRESVRKGMLEFFTHLFKPRIYVIDIDFMEGGVLLYHRDDGRPLKKSWIKPTLKNINLIWKGSVSLVTKDYFYSYSSGTFKEIQDNYTISSIKILAFVQ